MLSVSNENRESHGIINYASFLGPTKKIFYSDQHQKQKGGNKGVKSSAQDEMKF